MSKRWRFIIILVICILAGFFLFPTIKWYFLVDPEKKQLSTSTKDYLKEYAGNKAAKSVKELEKLLKKPYTYNNIKNPSLLLERMKNDAKPYYAYLKQNVSDSFKRIVQDYYKKMEIDKATKEKIAEEFNTILTGKLFYDPVSFKDAPFTKITRNTAESLQSVEYVAGDEKFIRINRTIIEELFPDEIVDIQLPGEFSYLSKEIKKYFISIKKKTPGRFTVTSAFKSFLKDTEMRTVIENNIRDEILGLRDLRKGILQLGLDLVGGMKVTMQVDFGSEVVVDEGGNSAEAGNSGEAGEGGEAGKETAVTGEKTEEKKKGTIPDEEKEAEVKKVLEILNNRIDQFGVSEPQIRAQGVDRIIVELPGLADPERIRSVILGKGRLSFHIVDEAGSEALNNYKQQNPANYLDERGKFKDLSFLPPGTILREVVEKDSYGIDQNRGWAVLEEKAGLSGEYIENASVQYDPQTLRPIVTFSLSDRGTKIFGDLTTEHEKDVLAVILDDKVKFQATIDEPIKNGKVQVRGQGIGYQEASDLALILRTGSMRYPLNIIGQETVGASLGEDAINQGLNAMFIGILLVMGFMLVYYRGGGIVSDLALMLNIFIMVGTLSVFNFTITLPSMAGVVLTVGMAVDANVIIFERIKEEYRAGKSRKAAIQAGFSRAFRTILDSNLTTAFAGIALAFFGKGVIQGFAVVLVVGIMTSMFTAIFVSHLIFDFVTDVFGATKIRLSWGVSK